MVEFKRLSHSLVSFRGRSPVSPLCSSPELCHELYDAHEHTSEDFDETFKGQPLSSEDNLSARRRVFRQTQDL